MKEVLTALVCCLSLPISFVNIGYCFIFTLIGERELGCISGCLGIFLFIACTELYKTISHFEIY